MAFVGSETQTKGKDMFAALDGKQSKQQEIDFYRQFVADCPATSYLGSILADTVGDVESAIRNDFGFIPSIRESWAARVDAQNELKEVNKQIGEARTELRRLERDAQTIRESIAELRSEARRIFNTK